MSPFLLRLIFHGLIAFVPQTRDGHNVLTALVVDGQSVPKNASGCVAPHHATISFTYQDAPSCADNGCSFKNNECTCTITHSKTIILDPPPDPGTATQTPQLPLTPPNQAVPQSAADADNFSYVMNLQTNQANLKLRPELLDNNAPLPPDLLARMTFVYTTLHACDLASQPENGAEVVRAYGLIRIASPPTGPEAAVAQRVIADTTITPAAGSSTQSVTLTLQDNTGAARSFRLNPQGQCDGTTTPCVQIKINNDRSMDATTECNDGVARDYALFYGLMQAPPQLEARSLPVADRGAGAPMGTADNLVPAICGAPQHGLNSRPICGMAVINP